MHVELANETDFASERLDLTETPQAANNAAVPSRSLITTTLPLAPMLSRAFRPDASFVAHLIAAAANLPQTRLLRRASPEQARASYQGAIERCTDRPQQQSGTKALLVA